LGTFCCGSGRLLMGSEGGEKPYRQRLMVVRIESSTTRRGGKPSSPLLESAEILVSICTCESDKRRTLLRDGLCIHIPLTPSATRPFAFEAWSSASVSFLPYPLNSRRGSSKMSLCSRVAGGLAERWPFSTNGVR